MLKSTYTSAQAPLLPGWTEHKAPSGMPLLPFPRRICLILYQGPVLRRMPTQVISITTMPKARNPPTLGRFSQRKKIRSRNRQSYNRKLLRTSHSVMAPSLEGSPVRESHGHPQNGSLVRDEESQGSTTTGRTFDGHDPKTDQNISRLYPVRCHGF